MLDIFFSLRKLWLEFKSFTIDKQVSSEHGNELEVDGPAH
jgi:hypothetical protein